MTTYRLNRKNILKVIGKLLTGRLAFSVTWNSERKKFEIILPATFDVAEAVPEVPAGESHMS